MIDWYRIEGMRPARQPVGPDLLVALGQLARAAKIELGRFCVIEPAQAPCRVERCLAAPRLPSQMVESVLETKSRDRLANKRSGPLPAQSSVSGSTPSRSIIREQQGEGELVRLRLSEFMTCVYSIIGKASVACKLSSATKRQDHRPSRTPMINAHSLETNLRPMSSKKCVGADHFAVGRSRDGIPRLVANAALDKVDRAVHEQHVHAARMEGAGVDQS